MATLNKKEEAAKKQHLLELKKAHLIELRRLREYELNNKIEFFNTPRLPANPLQEELFTILADPYFKIFTYSGANRIGKCLSYQTLIETSKGKVQLGDLYKEGKPFEVLAWDGTKKVVAQANSPIKKPGLHKCYDIGLSDGSTFRAADKHRVLTSHGWLFVEQIAATFDNLQGSSWEHAPSVLQQGALHCSERALNYQDCCCMNRNQCDGQLQAGLDIDRAFLPLQGDVQQLDAVSCTKDDQACKYTNNHRCQFDHPSNMDVLPQSEGRFFGLLCSLFYKSLKWFGEHSSIALQSSSGFLSQLQPMCESVQQANYVSSCDTSFKVIGANSIEYITPVRTCQEVYDFEVEKYHNYINNGLVHHNSTSLAILVISTLIGRYPWDNTRLPFSHSMPRKIRVIGQDWEKHIKAVLLPVLNEWWPKARPVHKKKNTLGIEAFWTDTTTGSTLEIMSNNQSSDLHEGWNGDLICYDEPCKRDIRIANARGLVDRQGREFFGMTLLKEAWIDKEVIKAKNPDGTPDRTVYNIQGDIRSNVGFGLTEAGVKQFEKMLTSDEKSARIDGKPSYLSGLVAKYFDRKIHLKPRFEIPLNWVVDVAIDIHPRKEQAILFVATSPKQERYVCFEVWAHGDGNFVGEQIIRIKQKFHLNINKVICDPLAKSDSNTGETTFDKIDRVLYQHDLILDTGGKDKVSGIIELNSHLRGPNNEPSIFFFDDMKKTVDEIESWMYDKETQKPQKINDDMMENLYRILLLDTQWSEDEEEEENYPQDSSSKWTGY